MPKTIKEILSSLSKEYPAISSYCNLNGCCLKEAIEQSLLSLLDEVEKGISGLDMSDQTYDEINILLSNLRKGVKE